MPNIIFGQCIIRSDPESELEVPLHWLSILHHCVVLPKGLCALLTRVPVDQDVQAPLVLLTHDPSNKKGTFRQM
jgi:hypothetical protein